MNSTTTRYAARWDSLRLATFSANSSSVNRCLDIAFRVAPSCRSVRKLLLQSVVAIIAGVNDDVSTSMGTQSTPRWLPVQLRLTSTSTTRAPEWILPTTRSCTSTPQLPLQPIPEEVSASFNVLYGSLYLIGKVGKVNVLVRIAKSVPVGKEGLHGGGMAGKEVPPLISPRQVEDEKMVIAVGLGTEGGNAQAGLLAPQIDCAHAVLEFVVRLGTRTGGFCRWCPGDRVPDSKVGKAHVVKGVSRRACSVAFV